jgi:hypothetical protein
MSNQTGLSMNSNANNAGENMAFFSCVFGNNAGNPLILNQVNSDFHFFATSFDFNLAPIIGSGIQVEFYGCHFEQSSGPFIDDSASTSAQSRVKFYGGSIQLNATTGTDAYMFSVGSAGPSGWTEFILNNITLFLGHPLTQIVNYTPRGLYPILFIEGLDLRPAATLSAIVNTQTAFGGLYLNSGWYNDPYRFTTGQPLRMLGGALVAGGYPTTGSGALGIGSNTAATATTGTSGATPAQVAGYLTWNLGGTVIKIPYYSN